MKLLLLTENYPPKNGGMAQSCDRFVRSLSKLGIPIDIMQFCGADKQPRSTMRGHGLHFVVPVDEDPGHAMNLAWNVIERQQGGSESSYTHVVAFGGWLPIIAAPIFSAWLERPLIVLIRGNDFDTALFSPKRSDVLREALQRAALICTVSEDKARKVRLLYPSANVTCVPNGIELAQWSATGQDEARAQELRESFLAERRDDCCPNGQGSELQNTPDRDRYGADRQQVLGLFGHLKSKKGSAFFIDAVRKSASPQKFHLLLVGEIEPQTLELLNAPERRGFTAVSYSTFPYLDRFELIPYYLACDWLVVPSFYDGLPNVVLEAGALGIPVLASQTGGMADLLKHNQNGMLFEAGDFNGCRWALSEIAAMTQERRIGLGGSLKALIQSHFSAEAESTQYASLFGQSLPKSAGPSLDREMLTEQLGILERTGMSRK